MSAAVRNGTPRIVAACLLITACAHDGRKAPAEGNDGVFGALDLQPDRARAGAQRERIFAAYLDAISRRLRPHWSPARAVRAVDPHGRVFGQKDRYMLLHVHLDRGGALRRVIVETGSGIDRLDLEAIAALERAAPFPPAPAPLLRNGLVDFRFRFHFKPPARSSHRPTHPPPSRVSP
jgi:TonB family protein